MTIDLLMEFDASAILCQEECPEKYNSIDRFDKQTLEKVIGETSIFFDIRILHIIILHSTNARRRIRGQTKGHPRCISSARGRSPAPFEILNKI